MQSIVQSIIIEKSLPLDPQACYRVFTEDFHYWWPHAYTWSKDKLHYIFINDRPDGLCTELGPYGFINDWGRVIEVLPGERLSFKWQIGPKREPVPDPERAGVVQFDFRPGAQGGCAFRMEHFDFERYGEEGAAYRDMMASEAGWPYIMGCFEARVVNLQA
jgi:uncharacterized protein YndB with AHSA1/START domain